jgi:xanthine dehydrogenase accessory factor
MTVCPAIRITVRRTAGSVPREVGASRLVTENGIEGTIGGGALEWEAMAMARAMLNDGRATDERTFPLGPALGQCCGGSVTLRFERASQVARKPGQPLWIWGAGHVGRALVDVIAHLPDWSITWVDTGAERFPEDRHEGVTILPAADLVRLVAHAPRDAHHLILTYSHELDLELCHALLGHGFASAGLIGSATKWARFQSRLHTLGHDKAQITRITCPIGDPALGKHPQAIAVGVAADLLKRAASGKTAAELRDAIGVT